MFVSTLVGNGRSRLERTVDRACTRKVVRWCNNRVLAILMASSVLVGAAGAADALDGNADTGDGQTAINSHKDS